MTTKFTAKPAAQYLLAFLLPIVIELILGWRVVPGLLQHLRLFDPDSWMRLLRIRQGLHAGWLSNTVVRDDSGHPLIIEWSRFYDGVLLLMAAPLMLFMPVMKAVTIAGVVATPIWAGLTGVGVAWGVAPWCRRGALWSAGLAVGVLPGIFRVNGLGSIQYHIFLLVFCVWCVAATVRAIVWRDSSKAALYGLAGGGLGGLALWAMPETWPFVLTAWAALLWADRASAENAPAASVAWAFGFAGTLLAALIIDPPAGGFFAPELDRLSLVYLWLGGMVALGAVLRLALGGERAAGGLGIRLAQFLVGLLPVGLWLLLWPGIIAGPWGIADPAEFKIFFGATIEMHPAASPWFIAALAAPGLWAAAFCGQRLAAALRRPGDHGDRADWAQAGAWGAGVVGGLFAAALCARFQLFSQFSAAAGAAVVPLLLERGLAMGDTLRGAGRRVGAVGLALLPIAMMIPGALALAAARPAGPGAHRTAAAAPPAAARTPSKGAVHRAAMHPAAARKAQQGHANPAAPTQRQGKPATATAAAHGVCHVTAKTAALLDRAAGAVVLTPVSPVPEILYKTDIIAAGSLFQHGIGSYIAVRSAWMTTARGAAPPAAITGPGIQYVAYCRGAPVPGVTGDPAMLWNRLDRRRAPAWLKPVGQTANWQLYKVIGHKAGRS